MKENQEILQRTLNLTLAVYRLTERFPEKESLTWQLRRVSNGIIGDLASDNISDANKKIELLLIYFKIGRAQQWVREINWLILENEYRRLLQEIIGLIQMGERSKKLELKRELGEIQEKPNQMSHNIEKPPDIKTRPTQTGRLSTRQQKIITELKNKGSIKMADLIPLFENQASERTIRNDLQDLLEQRLIGKTGSHKSTTYFIK